MGNPNQKITPVSTTAELIEGIERRMKVKVWRNVAMSGARINLLKALIKEKTRLG